MLVCSWSFLKALAHFLANANCSDSITGQLMILDQNYYEDVGTTLTQGCEIVNLDTLQSLDSPGNPAY